MQRNPEAGAGIKSFKMEAAEQVPGVQKVFKVEAPGFPTGFEKPLGGIVVVADDTWAALKGREALDIEWDKGANAGYDSVAYLEELQNKTSRNGKIKA